MPKKIIETINKHMLLFPFKMLREQEKKDIVKDDSYIVEPKYYGCRVFVSIFNNEVRVFSRKLNDEGYHVELTERIFIPKNEKYINNSVIFDGIIINNNCLRKLDNCYNNFEDNSVTYLLDSSEGVDYQKSNNILSIVLFDILYKNNKYLLNTTLKTRKKILDVEYNKLSNTVFWLKSPVKKGNVFDLFKLYTDNGYSGIVLKNENSKYNNTSYRDKFTAIKLKKDCCCGLNDIDLFISSYKKGVVGLSCFFDYGGDDIRQSVVCNVPIPDNISRYSFIYSDILSDSMIEQSYFGKVIQVSAKRFHDFKFYGVKPNWRRGFRIDKSMFDCVFDYNREYKYLEDLCCS